MEPNGFYKTPNVFSSPEDPPLLIMNIDIGAGVCEQLILRKNDNLIQTALDFCLKFELDTDLAEILIKNMEENLKNPQHQTNEIDNSDHYERPKSLADIYNDQKQQHCENLFFQSKTINTLTHQNPKATEGNTHKSMANLKCLKNVKIMFFVQNKIFLD